VKPNDPVKPAGALPLALGTGSFAVCFAAWGLIAAFAPQFRSAFHLSATQAALLVAVPVLLDRWPGFPSECWRTASEGGLSSHSS
jgi:nitrate/nitrite transporter NarK